MEDFRPQGWVAPPSFEGTRARKDHPQGNWPGLDPLQPPPPGKVLQKGANNGAPDPVSAADDVHGRHGVKRLVRAPCCPPPNARKLCILLPAPSTEVSLCSDVLKAVDTIEKRMLRTKNDEKNGWGKRRMIPMSEKLDRMFGFRKTAANPAAFPKHRSIV